MGCSLEMAHFGANSVVFLTEMLGCLLLGPRRGHNPSPENCGTFSLEMAHFGANSVVYFNRNVRLPVFTASTTTAILYIAVYCWRLTGSSYWGGFWGGAVTPSIKFLDFFT